MNDMLLLHGYGATPWMADTTQLKSVVSTQQATTRLEADACMSALLLLLCKLCNNKEQLVAV